MADWGPADWAEPTKVEREAQDALSASWSSDTDPVAVPPLPVLIGRDREKAVITAALGEVETGQGGVALFLSGESGAGKTALAEWCLASGQRMERPFFVARATCEPFHAGMSFFPVLELNRKLSGTHETVQELIAEGYGRGSNEAQTANAAFDGLTDAGARREYMMATFANAIVARSRLTDRPILLFLDDVERIDSPSVDALTVLLSRLDETKVMLLAAFRADVVAADKEHNLRHLLERARRGTSNVRLLKVDSISEADFPSLVHFFLPVVSAGTEDAGRLASAQLLRRMFLETEGNPLHVREVLRTLRAAIMASQDAGLPPETSGAWMTESEFWEIPASIEDAIASRLQPLAESDRNVLEAAAVIGRRCYYETLQRLTGLNENELLSVLDSLVEQDLLRETAGGTDSVEFTHGKVREVVYGQLTGLRRTRLHAQIAEVLEEQSGLMPEDEWEIAMGSHLFAARKYDAAGPYLVHAGRRSLDLQAGQEAAGHFRKALEALEKSNAPDPRKLADVRLLLGESLKVASQLDAALRELEPVAQSTESPTAQRWALVHIGDIHKLRDQISEAEKFYHESERLAHAADDRDLLAEVSADLAELHMRESERLAGVDRSSASAHDEKYKYYLDLETSYVADSDSRAARARSFRNRAKYARAHGDPNDAIRLYERSIEFQHHGVASHQFLIPYAKALRLVGRSTDAMSQVDIVLDWSRQIGALRSEAIARQYKGLLLLESALEGGPSRAELLRAARKEMDRALQLHSETGFKQGYRETCVDLFELELACGNLVSGLEYLERIPQHIPGASPLPRRKMVDAVLAQLVANGEVQRSARIRASITPTMEATLSEAEE